MCFVLEPYPEPFLFLLSKTEIKAVDLLTTDTTPLITGLKYEDPMTPAMDAMDRKLYFKDGINIARSNFDGTNKELVISSANPEDMTIDWIGRRIFWTEHRQERIIAANLNGKNKKVFKGEVWKPSGIAVDPTKG